MGPPPISWNPITEGRSIWGPCSRYAPGGRSGCRFECKGEAGSRCDVTDTDELGMDHGGGEVPKCREHTRTILYQVVSRWVNPVVLKVGLVGSNLAWKEVYWFDHKLENLSLYFPILSLLFDLSFLFPPGSNTEAAEQMSAYAIKHYTDWIDAIEHWQSPTLANR